MRYCECTAQLPEDDQPATGAKHNSMNAALNPCWQRVPL